MKPPTQKVASSSPISGSDAAPIIYFDGVIAFGHRDGIVQIELAANQLVPAALGSEEVKTKIVVTAHLRCSAGSAANLKDILEKMLAPSQTKQ